MRNKILYSLKVSPHKAFINLEGKTSNLIIERHGRCLPEKPKLTSPVMGQSHIMSPLIQCPEHNTPLFLAFLPKMHHLNQLMINQHKIRLKLKVIYKTIKSKRDWSHPRLK